MESAEQQPLHGSSRRAPLKCHFPPADSPLHCPHPKVHRPVTQTTGIGACETSIKCPLTTLGYPNLSGIFGPGVSVRSQFSISTATVPIRLVIPSQNVYEISTVCHTHTVNHDGHRSHLHVHDGHLPYKEKTGEKVQLPRFTNTHRIASLSSTGRA